jgi:hypothetical protein
MMRVLRNVLLGLAGGVVLMHMLVPHWHTHELGDAAHAELHRDVDTAVEVLQLFLHEADQMDDDLIPCTSLPTVPMSVLAVAVGLRIVLIGADVAATSIVRGHIPLARGCLSASGCRPPPFLG